MGRVDLAMRKVERFQRLYAVKHMHPHLTRDRRAKAMFEEEARIAGLLNHPNVVAVVDYGEDSYAPFMVMDYVEGLTLAQLQVLHIHRGEYLPLALTLRVVRDIALGLGAIHGAKTAAGRHLELVHRDLAPANILIGFDGTTRITDFGIAYADDRPHNTTAGLLKGTPGYIAPERLRFEAPTVQSDLFSLGVILYELLANERLYPGPMEASAQQVLVAAPPDIGEIRPELPASLIALLFRLLAKSPKSRPASAVEVASELEDAIQEFTAEALSDTRRYIQVVAAPQKDEHERRRSHALRVAQRTPEVSFIAHMQLLAGLVFATGILMYPHPLSELHAPRGTPMPRKGVKVTATKAAQALREPHSRRPSSTKPTKPKPTIANRPPRQAPPPQQDEVPHEMSWSGDFK